MKAAVPQYMHDMQQAAPGHRFGLYFSMWDETTWETYEFPNREHKSAKPEAINKVLTLHPDDKQRQESLVCRQQFQALTLGDTVHAEFARSTAPFATGMGYEHPLENGFAFLNPYGLPYMPGSSVKGVLRHAAEELLGEGEADGFAQEQINTLFGKGGDKEDKEGNQGALNFWDVFPQGKLALDIMTPHHGDYYQGEGSPHDSELPNPIVFLTVAQNAKFTFHVQRIRHVNCNWQHMLKQCFDHAFDWLGFGAKTAVGYGAMKSDVDEQEKFAETQAAIIEQQRFQAMSPEEQELAEIEQKIPGWDQNHGDFLSYVELRLEKDEPLSPRMHQIFHDLLARYYQGIMVNPDAVKGKKQQPKYKKRPRELAKKLMKLCV